MIKFDEVVLLPLIALFGATLTIGILIGSFIYELSENKDYYCNAKITFNKAKNEAESLCKQLGNKLNNYYPDVYLVIDTTKKDIKCQIKDELYDISTVKLVLQMHKDKK